jgi:hypothetical protein
VLRGIDARCTACGARRIPFTAQALNFAGKASRIGGAAAKFIGWASLVGGTSVAAFVALLLQSLWPAGFVGYAFAIPTLLISWAIGITLLIGGNRLDKSGNAKERTAQLEAIRSMAAHRRGVVTAREVATTLDLSEPQADALLTNLAKDPDEHVSLDLDDDGNLYYLFGLEGEELAAARWRIVGGPRVNVPPGSDAGQRAEAEAAALEEQERALRARR